MIGFQFQRENQKHHKISKYNTSRLSCGHDCYALATFYKRFSQITKPSGILWANFFGFLSKFKQILNEIWIPRNGKSDRRLIYLQDYLSESHEKQPKTKLHTLALTHQSLYWICYHQPIYDMDARACTRQHTSVLSPVARELIVRCWTGRGERTTWSAGRCVWSTARHSRSLSRWSDQFLQRKARNS